MTVIVRKVFHNKKELDNCFEELKKSIGIWKEAKGTVKVEIEGVEEVKV